MQSFQCVASGDGSLIPPLTPCTVHTIHTHSYVCAHTWESWNCVSCVRMDACALNWIVCCCVYEPFTYSNEEFDDIDFKMPACWRQCTDEPTQWMMRMNRWINFTSLVQWMCAIWNGLKKWNDRITQSKHSKKASASHQLTSIPFIQTHI